MPVPAHHPSVLYALLDFHVEAGADCALEETPQNRFNAPEPERHRFTADAGQRQAPPARPHEVAALASPAPQPRALTPATTASPDAVATAAREQARRAASLDDLRQILLGFEGCPLRISAKNLVFADGEPTARIMLVGEAPGAEEDRIGKPFVGRSGQLLDRMLQAIGFDRTSVYIANIVPWRPPGNRTPTPQEIAICRPFIERQIELVNPDFLVCLGGPSTQNLLDVKDGILRTRGRWFPYTVAGRTIQALATLHPAYLLRQPLQKRLAWRDFQALRQAHDALHGARRQG